jgi:hypothetical protein
VLTQSLGNSNAEKVKKVRTEMKVFRIYPSVGFEQDL